MAHVVTGMLNKQVAHELGTTEKTIKVHLPGLTGLDLQEELATRDIQIPIIFITGHGDIPIRICTQ
jgi:FixJ family two-component response regulator